MKNSKTWNCLWRR